MDSVFLEELGELGRGVGARHGCERAGKLLTVPKLLTKDEMAAARTDRLVQARGPRFLSLKASRLVGESNLSVCKRTAARLQPA